MSASVNKVILLGNLARDPEVRSVSDGQVCNLTVVTNETWKDKATGDRKERAEFHRVTIWNERLVEIASRYLKKGSQCLVEGQLQTRKWIDQAGQERYTTEIVLSKFRGELVLLGGGGGGSADRPPAAQQPTKGRIEDDLDDEIRW